MYRSNLLLSSLALIGCCFTIAGESFAVDMYEFNTERGGGFFQSDPADPDAFDQAENGASAWDITGRNGNVNSRQFGIFGQEFDVTTVSDYELDLTINPANQAQSLTIALIDFNHPLQTFGEIGSINFDLTGLAPGTHTVGGSLTPNAGVQLSDFADVEAVKVKYFPGAGGPIADLTLDRIKTVGPIGFYEQDFESIGPGNLPLNTFRSGGFTEAGFTISQQGIIAPGTGVGGGSAVSLLADAAGADGATFWNASVRSELDFRAPNIPWQQENMEISFDLMGSEAAEVNILIQSLTDDFTFTGTLSSSVTLTQANVFESFTVSVADFVDTTPAGQSGFDLEGNPRLNFVWQIEGEDWGFDDGNQITVDNISLRAVDVAGPALPGDFNNDGQVDATDFVVWQDNEGAADESSINNSGDGLNGVDGVDFTIWAGNYGAVAPAAISVPEPAAIAIAALACGLVLCRRPAA